LAVLNLTAAGTDSDDAEATVTTAVELALPYELARQTAISR
jgi:hypothetical protein